MTEKSSTLLRGILLVFVVGGLIFGTVLLAGCMEKHRLPFDNLPPQDAAFMDAYYSIPNGNFEPIIVSSEFRNYSEMYNKSKIAKDTFENKLMILQSMPTSMGFEDIKKEYCLEIKWEIQLCNDYLNETVIGTNENSLTAHQNQWNAENLDWNMCIYHTTRGNELIENYSKNF